MCWFKNYFNIIGLKGKKTISCKLQIQDVGLQALAEKNEEKQQPGKTIGTVTSMPTRHLTEKDERNKETFSKLLTAIPT